MGNRRNRRWQRFKVALPVWFVLAAVFLRGEPNAKPSLIAQSSDASGSQRSYDMSEAGTATDICDMIGAFYREGHIRHVLLRQVPESHVKDYALLGDVRRLMTDRGWTEATRGDYGISNYRERTFEVRRVQLTDKLPPAWVFSTSVGSLNNPLHWVLSSTPDGKRADRLLLQLGFEASGHFETAFVRFHGTPFAVGIWGGEFGPAAVVYRLDPGGAICSFNPQK
jgi:hypothetical protein